MRLFIQLISGWTLNLVHYIKAVEKTFNYAKVSALFFFFKIGLNLQGENCLNDRGEIMVGEDRKYDKERVDEKENGR